MTQEIRSELKNIIVFGLILTGLVGCVFLLSYLPEPPDPLAKFPKDDVHVVMHDMHWSVIEIEGCEYFYNNSSRGDILTHKGNCKNPIHNPRLEK